MNRQPFYDKDGITIYHGDCRAILPSQPDKSVDLILTDPPYLGREDLFQTEDVLLLIEVLVGIYPAFVFWPCCGRIPSEPDAIHIWHKAVPIHPHSVIGNVAGHHYERILAYRLGAKSEVFRYAAIIPGFTACAEECVKHPTQKPLDLIGKLVQRTYGTVLDPFMGSGTTLVAAKLLGRKAIGIEIEEKYCEIAVKRLEKVSRSLGHNLVMSKEPISLLGLKKKR